MSVPSISIQNKNGVSMLIDEEDLGLLTQHKKGHWCFVFNKGYAVIIHKKGIGGDGRREYFHRLIMKASVGLEVYHINKNRFDNRKENLRLCTRSQHRLNIAGYGASKFKGVSLKRAKWKAVITTNGIKSHLGYFKTEIEAARAYDAAVRLQNCEFRTLNFPDEVPSA